MCELYIWDVQYGGHFMSKGKLIFTNDNEYYTPKYVVEAFGKFDYDPATIAEKAKEFGIPNFDTIDTDGLSKDWTQYKRIWINPPFTRKHEFLAKAWETYQKVKNDIYILVPIEFLTTLRFQDSTGGGTVYIPRGRIQFESGLGKRPAGVSFGTVVVKLDDTFGIEFINLKQEKQLGLV